jgi:hypothetical protein
MHFECRARVNTRADLVGEFMYREDGLYKGNAGDAFEHNMIGLGDLEFLRNQLETAIRGPRNLRREMHEH